MEGASISIAQAEIGYQEFGNSTKTHWRDIVDKVRKNADDKTLETQSHVIGLSLTSEMLPTTQKLFNMFASKDLLIQELYSDFRRMVQRLAEEGGTMNALVTLRKESAFEELRRGYEETVHIIHGTPKGVRDFFISDGCRSREEFAVTSVTKNSDERSLASTFRFPGNPLNEVLQTRFNGLWKGQTGEYPPGTPKPKKPWWKKLLKRAS